MVFLFELCLIILLWIEYQVYKTCITPFFVIGCIYLFSIPIVDIIGVQLGYYKLNDKTISLFLMFLGLIFFLDIVPKLIVLRKLQINVSESYELIVRQQKFIWYCFLVMLIGYACSLIQCIRLYGFDIKGKSGGIFGHMGLFCIAISPFILTLIFQTKKKKYVLALIMLYFIMFLFGVKTYIFLSLVASALLYVQQSRLSFWKFIKIGFIFVAFAFIVFVVIYSVIPFLRAGKNVVPLKESLQHLFYYFSAPFLCSNTYFDMPLAEGEVQGMRIMFSPAVTLFEFLLGNKDYPTVIMQFWAPISEAAHRTESNVGGLFSEGVFHIGYIGSILYVGFIALYTHFLFMVSKLSKYYRASSSLAITLLGLSFFCNYYTLLSVFEIIIYLFFFETILMCMEKKKIYFKDWSWKQYGKSKNTNFNFEL